MVLVHYPLSSGLVSESGIAAFLHHVSALARGKLVAIFVAEAGEIFVVIFKSKRNLSLHILYFR
jgi:hypothetical protein